MMCGGAVNTRNSNAGLVVTEAREARTIVRASATALWGSARMCWTTSCCRRRSHGQCRLTRPLKPDMKGESMR